MRFQTQLMVVSNSCGSQSYTEFTHRNASTLAAYQQKMIGYFRRVSGRGADTAFDRFITSLANQMALSAGKETVSVLCTRSADLLSKGQTFGKDDFVHYVVQQAARRAAPIRPAKTKARGLRSARRASARGDRPTSAGARGFPA